MKTTPLARDQKQRREERAEALKRNSAPLGFYLGEPIYSYSDYELQKAKHEIREKVHTEAGAAFID